jgi:hypothetical protein
MEDGMKTYREALEANYIEQALRRSHCSNTGKEHACIGTCTITKDGIELECSLCGTDKRQNIEGVNEWLSDRASAVLHAAGMRYASLSDETKLAVLKEMGRDVCPGCKAIHFHVKRFEDYRLCQCGWTWYASSGWKKPKEPQEVPLV